MVSRMIGLFARGAFIQTGTSKASMFPLLPTITVYRWGTPALIVCGPIRSVHIRACPPEVTVIAFVNRLT